MIHNQSHGSHKKQVVNKQKMLVPDKFPNQIKGQYIGEAVANKLYEPEECRLLYKRHQDYGEEYGLGPKSRMLKQRLPGIITKKGGSLKIEM